MQAIVYTRYGAPDVLQLEDVDTPAPKDNEVLVKVHAVSLNALDWRPFTMPLIFVRLMRGGLREPKDRSLGVDVAGRVEAVGAKVTQLQPGDEVFGTCHGACAEYVCTAERKLVVKPADVSFEAAAAVPVAAFTALQAVRDRGKVQRGHRVLVNGAGGGVGTFAVQLAKFFGADVTAVCGPRNVEVARSLGADHVIDYTREDFTRSGRRYDVIVAVNGYHSVLDYRRALTPRGTCVVLGGAMSQLLQALLVGPLVSSRKGRSIQAMMTRPTHEDLVLLKELLETGRVVSVIDRCYPLAETADAIRYLLDGHPRGKVVITVSGSRAPRDRQSAP